MQIMKSYKRQTKSSTTFHRLRLIFLLMGRVYEAIASRLFPFHQWIKLNKNNIKINLVGHWCLQCYSLYTSYTKKCRERTFPFYVKNLTLLLGQIGCTGWSGHSYILCILAGCDFFVALKTNFAGIFEVMIFNSFFKLKSELYFYEQFWSCWVTM